MQKTFHPDNYSLRERLCLSLDYFCSKKGPCGFGGLGMPKRGYVFPRDIPFFQISLTPLKCDILPHISPDLEIILSSRWGDPGQWPSDAGAKLHPPEEVLFLLSHQYPTHGPCSNFSTVVLFYFYRFLNVFWSKHIFPFLNMGFFPQHKELRTWFSQVRNIVRRTE